MVSYILNVFKWDRFEKSFKICCRRWVKNVIYQKTVKSTPLWQFTLTKQTNCATIYRKVSLVRQGPPNSFGTLGICCLCLGSQSPNENLAIYGDGSKWAIRPYHLACPRQNIKQTTSLLWKKLYLSKNYRRRNRQNSYRLIECG